MEDGLFHIHEQVLNALQSDEGVLFCAQKSSEICDETVFAVCAVREDENEYRNCESV